MREVPAYWLTDDVTRVANRIVRRYVANASPLDVRPDPTRWAAWLVTNPNDVAAQLLQTCPNSEWLDRCLDKAAVHFYRENRLLHESECNIVALRNIYFIHDYAAQCRRRGQPVDQQHYYELLVFLLWPVAALEYLTEVAEPDKYVLVAGNEPARRTG